MRSRRCSSATRVAEFFRESLKFGENNHVLEEMHHVPALVAWLPTVMMALGFAVAYQFYIRRPDIPVALAEQHSRALPLPAQQVVLRRALRLPVRAPGALARPRALEGRRRLGHRRASGLTASRRACIDVTRNVVRLQTGYLYHYAFAMLIGVAAFITWFMFAGAPH